MPEWAWPSSGKVYLFALLATSQQQQLKNLMRFTFHVNKNIKQTYKGGLHSTVICCTNKCIINESYIPEHQNKLNIYDSQNCEFFANFFNRKKIRKIR